MRGVAIAAFLMAVVVGGCQPAERYGPRPERETPPKKVAAPEETPKKAEVKPLNPDIQWIEIYNPPRPDALIDFVHVEKAPEAWNKLSKFWNEPAAGKDNKQAIVQIKVPLGLPDPREYIPAGDPLTVGKWKLGRQLFYDDTWLEAKPGTSCTTCHQPEHGLADREHTHGGGFNAPTLVNCVFNRWQFWDGRAARLEEVVQRTLEDERESNPPKPFRHTWSGVIARLRNKAGYHEQFNKVFGTPPGEEKGAERANITQDTLGRALACYLRTLLAGDSIQDRALHEQTSKHSPTLLAEHYEAVLDDAALADLDRAKVKKAEVARELLHGYQLFHGLDKGRALVNCYRCHTGRTYTDNEFHNLGVGPSSELGREQGRFAQVPIGQKNRYLIDAYKTPTLRGLLRTNPYLHNGSLGRLREVVQFYNHGAAANDHLDPELRGPDGGPRLLGLTDPEIDALLLFLRSLNGRDIDPDLRLPARK